MFTWLTSTHIGKLIATFLISMLPIIELRGGIPYGVGFGLKPYEAFIVAVLGNMLPVPFILLLLEKVLKWMKKQENFLGKAANWLEKKAYSKQSTIERFKALGLFILVAIPLPGTGAWTGSLVAVVLGIGKKKAFPIIFAGVITAGVIMLLVSYGVKAIF
ncbi:MAG: small multi-drug export protein [Oscillospiraceae bacterium]|nr:small multi-drug export protein [Oscillospiraceae bacterium]